MTNPTNNTLNVLARQSDAELLQRIAKQQDSAAFEELYARHKNACYNLAQRLTRTREQAEDAVQDAFLRIWRYSQTYDPNRKPRPWILRVLARASISRQNDALRTARERSFDEMEESLDDNDLALESIDKREEISALRLAINRLPEPDRVLVALYFGAGFSQEECGKELGIPARTVSDILKRTLNHLRTKLEFAGFSAGTPILCHESMGEALLTGNEPSPQVFENIRVRLNEVARHSVGNVVRTRSAALKVALAITTVIAGISICKAWLSASVVSSRPPAPTAKAKGVGCDDLEVSDVRPGKLSTNPPFSRKWTFKSQDPPEDIQVILGGWRWVESGGPDGTGCMETTSESFEAELRMPVHNAPIHIAMQARIIRQPTGFIRDGAYLGVAWSSYSNAGVFRNVGERVSLGNDEWFLARSIVTSNFIDQYTGNKRMSVVWYQPEDQACLRICAQGRHRIDLLAVDEIEESHVPDLDPFRVSILRISPDERSGRVLVPDLESKRPPEAVEIVFMKELEPDHDRRR